MSACKGQSNLYGEQCPSCHRFQDDCDGADEWYENDDGDWVTDCDCGSCGECRDRKREEYWEGRMEEERY